MAIILTNHMVDVGWKFIESVAHERGYGFALDMVAEKDAKDVIASVYRAMASAAPEAAPVANTSNTAG